MDENIISVQQELQRKYGRCMFRLQQIEQLLKTLLPHVSVQGAAEKISSIRDRQIADARLKTMGGLVSMLTGEFLAPTTIEEEQEEEPENVGNAGWISAKFQISMSDRDYEETRLAFVDLVEMRNGLVHHFLEKFNISLVSECLIADAYLDECDEKIGRQLLQLQQWAKSLVEVQAKAASYVASVEFENALVHGVMPDGEVHWERSTIVEYLRNAEKACAQHGWTLLDTAIAQVRVSDNEQTPSKYGCKTWRGVLRKSEQFDIKRDVNPSNGRGQVWYRSRDVSDLI
ncbi:OST-HTH/LOTUS domain-containing protein [Undibacterium danionis]|uniref:OST-HTH/LOTUS domain-containing protein n=1 Tax=Undibacterium danionis TaxID=1812100 RepID=A0ABV6IKA0_9BURK